MTNRQVFFVVFLSIIGAGEAVTLAANANFPGALISIAIFLVLSSAFAYVSKKFPECAFRDYAPKVFGNFFGWILNFACFVVFSIALILFIRQCVGFIKYEFLGQTPFWLIAAILIFIFHYASSKGLTNIGRLSEFLGLLILIAAIAAISFMLLSKNFGGIDFTAAPKQGNSLFLFASSLIILTIPIKKTSGVFWGYLAGATVIFLLMLGVFTILSPNQVAFFDNPLFAAIRETRSDKLQLVARLDSLFILLWLFASFCRGAIFKHAVDVFANAILPQKLSRRWSFLAVSLIIFVCTIWGQPIVLGTDSKDIQNKNIVSAVAADESDGTYTLMFEISDFSKEEPDTSWLIGHGTDIAEAQLDAESKTDRELYTDSARAVILSGNVNAHGFAEILRDNQHYRKNMSVFRINDIQELQEMGMNFVGKFLENSKKETVTFLDILNGETFLPYIEVENNNLKIVRGTI